MSSGLSEAARAIGAAVLITVSLALVDCGGGSLTIPTNSPSPSPVPTSAPTTTLRGHVAVGRPVVGAAIAIKCANGKSYSSSSDASGSYVVSVDVGALPCAFESTGGSVAGVAYLAKLHSVALAAGIANITPLTDYALSAFAKSSASAYFAQTFDSATWAALTTQALLAAQNIVIANLRALSLTIPSADFFTADFSPIAGDAYDALLAAIAAETSAILQVLAESVAADIVGSYPGTGSSSLAVASMAGTWNTTDTKINRLTAAAPTGIVVGDRCRIDVTPGGKITVTTGTHAWSAQIAPNLAGATLDMNYAPYHYSGFTPAVGDVAIGWGFFGQSATVFSDQTPMSTTVRLNGSDAVFCANYRY